MGSRGHGGDLGPPSRRVTSLQGWRGLVAWALVGLATILTAAVAALKPAEDSR